MKPKYSICLLAALLPVTVANASDNHPAARYMPSDSVTAVRILREKPAGESSSIGQRIRATAEEFVGTPYKGGTLEGEPETLRINFGAFDCTTFVESVLALSLTAAAGDTTFNGFSSTLAAIRYSGGESDSYTKRLHYFSQWIKENAARGVIEEIIPRGITRCEVKKIDFMSRHAELYPALKEKGRVAEIAETERELSGDTVCYVPKEKIPQLEKGYIRDGDIIAIVTAKEGLDITHVGFAALLDGEPHLLHASSAAKEVVLDRRTLYQYLIHYPSHRGIRILRATKQIK